MRTFKIKDKYFGVEIEAPAEYHYQYTSWHKTRDNYDDIIEDVLVSADGETLFSLKDVFIEALVKLNLATEEE